MSRSIVILILVLSSFVSQAQSVFFMDCNGRDGVEFTLDANNSPDATGRNVFINMAGTIEIRFNSALMRWEIKTVGMGGSVLYYSNAIFFPNPPSSSAVAWTDNGACGTELSVTGNGTQAAVCPDNVPPSISCRNLFFVLDSMTQVINITPADVLTDTIASCGIASIVLSDSTFTYDDLGVNPVLVTITDFGGKTGTCTANVTLSLPAPVPTFSEWGLLILALSFLILGVVMAFRTSAVRQGR